MRKTFSIALVFSVLAFLLAGIGFVAKLLRERPLVDAVSRPTPEAAPVTVAPLPGAELMGALCGEAPLRMAKDGLACEIDACGTGTPAEVTFARAFLGSFSGTGLEEALLDLDLACATHAEGFGGWALLHREGAGWTRVALRSGQRPGVCTVVNDEPRDLLVCESSWMAMGESGSSLGVRAVMDGELRQTQVLARAVENSGALCQTMADEISWKAEGRGVKLKYVRSRAKAEVLSSVECPVPPPREAAQFEFDFTLQDGQFLVAPELREAYDRLALEWKE